MSDEEFKHKAVLLKRLGWKCVVDTARAAPGGSTVTK